MRRLVVPLTVALVLLVVGMALAQTTSQQSFTVLQQLGADRPRGIKYDPNYDQFAWVDDAGRLVLVDASTYTPEHILYETPDAFNAYEFSHDGQWLALAVDVRMELWNTQTGELTVTLEPDAALNVQGPIHFGDDDRLLQFDALVRTPEELRRSENDTIILPWIWDLASARREATSILPGRARAYAFFDYRGTGLVLAPGNIVIAGAPSRLMVMDADDASLPIISEIDANRQLRDPFDVWHSLRDDYTYVLPAGYNEIVQIDPATNTTFNIPVGYDLPYSSLLAMNDMGRSSLHRTIGEAMTQQEVPLLRLLLGNDYLSYQNFSPTSVILLDILAPLTVSPQEAGFLIYRYSQDRGSGVIEFIRPTSIQQFVLHPDNRHLMVRRTGAPQAIEIYDLETGDLTQTIYPDVPDEMGSHTLAFNADGSSITSDFQRFDTFTGRVLYDNDHIGFTSGEYIFSDDSQSIVTRVGDTWQIWDIATASLIRESTVHLQGEVVARREDMSRYLMMLFEGEDLYYETVDIWSGERWRFKVPQREGYIISAVIPDDDWRQFIVTYDDTTNVSSNPISDMVVYDADGNIRTYLVDEAMPAAAGRIYEWLDEHTIVIQSSQMYSEPSHIYGIDYHESGLPQCMVDAYTGEWEQFLPLWELYNLNLNSAQLNRLTVKICNALPADAADFTSILTPTPQFSYEVQHTADTNLIAGVPACLTTRFANEPLAYAEIWRAMSKGMTEEEILNLEDMLCEGLITSIDHIEATPTMNPNMLGAATATPIEQVANTVDSGRQPSQSFMTLDIETQARSVGAYMPPRETTVITSQQRRVLDEYENIYNRYPQGNTQLSPDGNYMAVQNERGFITIYQLGIPRPQQVYVHHINEQQAQVPIRSTYQVGLLPTATQGFDYLGQPQATITPTISPTQPPTPSATFDWQQRGDIVEICPYDKLFTLDNPPPDYDVSGSLYIPGSSVSQMLITGQVLSATTPTAMPDEIRTEHSPSTWMLDPQNGVYRPIETLPNCEAQSCRFSPDGQWVIHSGEQIILAHAEGTDPLVITPQTNEPFFNIRPIWLPDSRLQIIFQQYDLDLSPNLLMYLQTYDPNTGIYGEVQSLPEPPQVYDLPTTIISRQPLTGKWALVTTPYNAGAISGYKYYMYDIETDVFTYFSRSVGAEIMSLWHPMGQYLYYKLPTEDDWFVFDTETTQHSVLGSVYNGLWSPDGTYSAGWYTAQGEEQRQRWANKERLPKLQIWDSTSGQIRRYCLPETGLQNYEGQQLLWSPDSRYLAFRLSLPPEGDVFPVPTVEYTPQPTPTPMPLEQIYDYQAPRTLILDTQTGSVTIISVEAADAFTWVAQEVQP